MTAKEYLQKVIRMKTAIEQKEAELSFLRETSVHITAEFGREHVSQSPVHDRMGETVAKIVDTEAKLLQEYQTMLNFRADAARRIDQLPDALHSKVLYMRYLGGKGLQAIADESGYTYRHCTRLHGDALKEFEQLNRDLFPDANEGDPEPLCQGCHTNRPEPGKKLCSSCLAKRAAAAEQRKIRKAECKQIETEYRVCREADRDPGACLTCKKERCIYDDAE